MQLNMTTDYAVRIMIGLARTTERMAASDLSAQMNIPKPYVAKIMAALKLQGWLDVTGGVRGGYQLAVPAEKITLRQIFIAMSDGLVLCRCLEKDGYCSWSGAETCQLRRAYSVIQERLDYMLDQITLKSLVETGSMDVCRSLRKQRDAMAPQRAACRVEVPAAIRSRDIATIAERQFARVD